MRSKMEGQKLKIMMIAPTPFFADRGCHIRIFEEYKHLAKLGHEVIICTYHLGRDIQGVKTYRTVSIPWYKKLSAGPSYHKLYIDIFLFLLCLLKAISFRPDIIHAHLHEGTLIGCVIGRLLKIPVIADMQGSLFEELVDHHFISREGVMARLWQFIERRVTLLPNYVVTSSEQARKVFEERFHLGKDRLSHVGDGVDVDFIHPGYPVEELKRKLLIPENKKVILYIGILTPYQGIDCLLEAVQIIKKKRANLFFLICGFPNVEKYLQMCREMEIEDMVRFTGRISYFDTPYYLCLADLGVSAKLSRTEANSKVLNYMAAGLPVVAFDSPNNWELMGELGIYADFGISASLAEKIMEIVGDEERMQRLKLEVRKRIEEQWSWDLAVQKLLYLYCTVMKKKRRGTHLPRLKDA
jgi:glycosyltransferase involved in cell wall biosynthesis